jgi:hypothetical protein
MYYPFHESVETVGIYIIPFHKSVEIVGIYIIPFTKVLKSWAYILSLSRNC